MCKSIEIYGTGFSKFKVHTKQIELYKKKMVLHFTWQEYMRLVCKKVYFWVFFTSKIIFFFSLTGPRAFSLL